MNDEVAHTLNEPDGSIGGRPAFFRRFVAMLMQRCPRCCRGKMFRGLITMNDPCPVCGMDFEREPGYLLGAMYFGYFLSVGVMVPLFYLLGWLLPDWNQMVVAFLAFIVYLPLVPVVFRYSRVLWIHYDRTLAPSALSNHGGWLKWREAQRNNPE